MTSTPSGGGKLPGKTLYAGRRRAMTRTSGFKVHMDTSGGEYRRDSVKKINLGRGEDITIVFRLPNHRKGEMLGYGVWFWHTPGVTTSIAGGPERRTLTEYAVGSWNKLGSIWQANDDQPASITVTFTATRKAAVALYAPLCGRVSHHHMTDARAALLRNMYQFVPEAIFIPEDGAGEVVIEAPQGSDSQALQELILKSCNRCGRYLPVNVPAERNQLSFSNHCVAAHRRPCRHATFGRLRNIDDASDILPLDYGFQLECRFCKKFEVNAAHNPQRSSAQMKEDGARRRAFELLLADLYGGTPQLRYRHQTGSELADDVWRRFGGACFNCGTLLPRARNMHLDHTRPLALLWPLDGTATALCKSCNCEKRDRTASDFYPPKKLVALAKITGIPLGELSQPHPNETALDLLLSRLEWFFGEFLLRNEMTKERDGKITGELVVKALQKVLERSHVRRSVNLQDDYEKRRARRR